MAFWSRNQLDEARAEIARLDNDKAALIAKVDDYRELLAAKNEQYDTLVVQFNVAQEAALRSIASTETLNSVPKALLSSSSAILEAGQAIAHAIGALSLATERGARAKQSEVEFLKALPRE